MQQRLRGLGRGRRLLLALAAGGAAFGIAGVVQASIPDASGVIHACYSKANGALHVIDTSAGDNCDTKKETALDWSRTGPTGPRGVTGPQGQAGTNGANGADGKDGARGATGPAGAQGPRGATGPQGAVGANGTNGVNGTDGKDGATGPQGPRGATGTAGADGTNGATGPQGVRGATGPQGPQGPQGPPGSGGSNIPGHVVRSGLVDLTDSETPIATLPSLPTGAWLLTLSSSVTTLGAAVDVECTVDDNLVGNNTYSNVDAFPGQLRSMSITRAISTPGGRDVNVLCRAQTVGGTARVVDVVAVATPLPGNVILNY